MAETGESTGPKRKRTTRKEKAEKQPNSKSGEGSNSKSGPEDVVLMNSRAKYPRYALLEVRQEVVERSKRAVYAHLTKMTNAHINLAAKGNCQSAKFLFEFAGIYDLSAAPGPADSQPNAFNPAAILEDPSKAVLSFYKKLGTKPPQLAPAKTCTPAIEAGMEQPALQARKEL